MPELPSHTDTGSAPSGPAIDPGGRRRGRLVAAAVVVLVLLVVVLHLSGVIKMGGH